MRDDFENILLRTLTGYKNAKDKNKVLKYFKDDNNSVQLTFDAVFVRVFLVHDGRKNIYNLPTGKLYTDDIAIMLRELMSAVEPRTTVLVSAYIENKIYKAAVCKDLMSQIIDEGKIWLQFPKASKVVIAEDTFDVYNRISVFEQ